MRIRTRDLSRKHLYKRKHMYITYYYFFLYFITLLTLFFERQPYQHATYDIDSLEQPAYGFYFQKTMILIGFFLYTSNDFIIYGFNFV